MLNDSLLELLFIEHWGEGLVGENNCPSGVARAPLDFATHFLESRRLSILHKGIWIWPSKGFECFQNYTNNPPKHIALSVCLKVHLHPFNHSDFKDVLTGWRSSTKSNLHCKIHTSCKLFQVLASGLRSIVWYIDVWEDSMNMETSLLSTGSSAINTDNRNLWHCRVLAKFGITSIKISNWISQVEITVHNSYRKHHFFLGVTHITWFHPLQEGKSVAARRESKFCWVDNFFRHFAFVCWLGPGFSILVNWETPGTWERARSGTRPGPRIRPEDHPEWMN